MYQALLLFTALLATTAASAQRMLLVREGADEYLVRHATGDHVHYLKQGNLTRIPVADAEMRLAPIETFKPGYIWLSSGAFEQLEAPDGMVRVQLDAQIVATRNLNDVALVVALEDSSTKKTVVTHPIGNLLREEEKVVDFTLEILAEDEGLILDAFFISGGLELRSGDQQFPSRTPYDYYLKDVVQGRPQDGAIAVIRSRPPALVQDTMGSVLKGKVMLDVSVDRSGYVTAAEAVEYDDWRLAESALRTIYLWHFKPAIQDGNPIAARVRLPVVF